MRYILNRWIQVKFNSSQMITNNYTVLGSEQLQEVRQCCLKINTLNETDRVQGNPSSSRTFLHLPAPIRAVDSRHETAAREETIPRASCAVNSDRQ